MRLGEATADFGSVVTGAVTHIHAHNTGGVPATTVADGGGGGSILGRYFPWNGR